MKRTMDFVYYSKTKVDDLSKFARNLSLYLRYFLRFMKLVMVLFRSRNLSIAVFLSEVSNPLLFEKEGVD